MYDKNISYQRPIVSKNMNIFKEKYLSASRMHLFLCNSSSYLINISHISNFFLLKKFSFLKSFLLCN